MRTFQQILEEDYNIDASCLRYDKFIQAHEDYLKQNEEPQCTEDRHIEGCRCEGKNEPYKKMIKK